MHFMKMYKVVPHLTVPSYKTYNGLFEFDHVIPEHNIVQ